MNVQSAASNGKRTVIVYGEPLLQTIVLDREANVVDGPRALTSDRQYKVALVASNGRDFLVAWSGDRVTASRFDENGAPLSSSPIILSSHTQLYQLGSDGDSYVAIVSDKDAGVVAQHVSAAGDLLERTAVPLQQLYPGLVFAAGSYLLMDGNAPQRTIFVHRLDRTGKPIGESAPLSRDTSFGAGGTLASNGSDAAAFWTEWNGPQSFRGAIVNGATLAASNVVTIARSANPQTTPDAATSGRNVAIVWNEPDGTYAGRLTLDGQMLDGRGIRIGNRSISAPRIVFDGANYLVAWIESGAPAHVKSTRLSPESGTLLDAAGITVASTQCGNGLTLAAGPSTLIAWSECDRVIANTIARDGFLGTAITVTPAETTRTGSVSAAWNGTEWLVAWEDLVLSGGPIIDLPVYDTFLKAARISASHTLLDPKPIAISETRTDDQPLVASDGNDFLVALTRYTTTSPQFSVVAQRVSSDGSLLANGTIGSGRAKNVAWDGQQYAVAFASYSSDRPSTLYVTHVAADGPIESSAAQSIVSSIADPDAALIVTQPGRVIAAYSRVAAEAAYGDVDRVFVNVPHLLRRRPSH